MPLQLPHPCLRSNQRVGARDVKHNDRSCGASAPCIEASSMRQDSVNPAPPLSPAILTLQNRHLVSRRPQLLPVIHWGQAVVPLLTGSVPADSSCRCQTDTRYGPGSERSSALSIPYFELDIHLWQRFREECGPNGTSLETGGRREPNSSKPRKIKRSTDHEGS